MLAAYADDELEPAVRDAVQRWLAQHLDSQHEIEAQRQLVRLYQDVASPEPSERTWATVLAGIRSRVLPARPRFSRRLLRWSTGLAAAAASIALVVFAARWQPTQPAIPMLESPELQLSLPVASSEDVTVTHMDDADRGMFVIGELPLLRDEQLVLAGHGDVEVMELKPDPGMSLEFQRDDSSAPMIFAVPRDAAPDAKIQKSDAPLPK
jgi:hypothetical protein